VGTAEKSFQGQRSKVKVMTGLNAITAEACISTAWRRGSLVCIFHRVVCRSIFYNPTQPNPSTGWSNPTQLIADLKMWIKPNITND